MRTLKFLLQKEFRQIFRNKTLLRMLFMVPIIQLLILPQAATYTVRNINIAFVDHDHSSYSQKLISKILSSGYFRLSGDPFSYNDAYKLIENDKADIVMEIPQDFERNLIRHGNEVLSLSVNAINGVKASVGANYLSNIIRDFNNNLRMDLLPPSAVNITPVIDVASSYWYNTSLSYYLFMVPGILVLLTTLIASNLTALNIVKEKEVGTIEQINVTPIKKYHFILGKLLPFWVIGIIIFSIGLLIARFVYGIIPLGNLSVLYLFLTVYLLAILGFGLLISTYSETQQQAQSLTFFFILIFNLMSGLFTPVDSMPVWAQYIAHVIPIYYFIDVVRMVVIKGSYLNDIMPHILIMTCMAIILNTWAMINYRKTT